MTHGEQAIWELLLSHHPPEHLHRALLWQVGRRPFRVCARCLGIALGTGLALLLGQTSLGRVAATPLPALLLVVAGIAPGMLDFHLQLVHARESTNPRRVLTGLSAGAAAGLSILLAPPCPPRFGPGRADAGRGLCPGSLDRRLPLGSACLPICPAMPPTASSASRRTRARGGTKPPLDLLPQPPQPRNQTMSASPDLSRRLFKIVAFFLLVAVVTVGSLPRPGGTGIPHLPVPPLALRALCGRIRGLRLVCQRRRGGRHGPPGDGRHAHDRPQPDRSLVRGHPSWPALRSPTAPTTSLRSSTASASAMPSSRFSSSWRLRRSIRAISRPRRRTTTGRRTASPCASSCRTSPGWPPRFAAPPPPCPSRASPIDRLVKRLDGLKTDLEYAAPRATASDGNGQMARIVETVRTLCEREAALGGESPGATVEAVRGDLDVLEPLLRERQQDVTKARSE